MDMGDLPHSLSARGADGQQNPALSAQVEFSVPLSAGSESVFHVLDYIVG